MNDAEYVRQALDVWADSWPRRITTNQVEVEYPSVATQRLLAVEGNPDSQPYMSTYSFPRGHTTEDEVPQVDCLFIDFDVPEDGGTDDGWKRQLSRVLVRTRKVAQALLGDDPASWRASLSGSKGVHLYLDFPAIDPENGTVTQFKSGLNSYAQDVQDRLEAIAGIDLDEYLDVTSADLARLCRVPNTLHSGATERFGEPRYCVPVSIEELARIGPDEYVELTRERRELPAQYEDGRQPNEYAGRVVTQRVRVAEDSRGASRRSTAPADMGLVRRYRDECNTDIELDDLPILITDRPCVLNFRQHPEMFDHGDASHLMETSVILALAERNVPIDVMCEFLDTSERFDEHYTKNRIYSILSRMDEDVLFGEYRKMSGDRDGYNQFNCSKIWREAPMFCVGESCHIFRRDDSSPAASQVGELNP